MDRPNNDPQMILRKKMGYKFPEKCCGTCCHSFISQTYSDKQCDKVSGSIIDIGGVCNEYERDNSSN